MKLTSLACAMSALLLTAVAAQSAEHIPGTASSRPAAFTASAGAVPPLNVLIYDAGTNARHANLARARHSAASLVRPMGRAATSAA